MSDRIATPFGATTTAMEVVAGVDLGGKRAIVTGGASGIGVETARALATAGANVTLAVRNRAAGTSKTAKKPDPTNPASAVVSPGMPWIRNMLRDCGRYRWGCSLSK